MVVVIIPTLLAEIFNKQATHTIVLLGIHMVQRVPRAGCGFNL